MFSTSQICPPLTCPRLLMVAKRQPPFGLAHVKSFRKGNNCVFGSSIFSTEKEVISKKADDPDINPTGN